MAESSVRRVESYIALMNDRLAAGVELHTLANEGGVSRNQVIKDFKQVVGTTPGAYFRQLRLERSKEIITNGGTLAQAATDAGFADQSHFTRQFRKAFGMTPNKYR